MLRYQRQHRSSASIAAELGASTLVVIAVRDADRGKLVSAFLMDAASGQKRRVKTYALNDVSTLAAQRSVAHQIVGDLKPLLERISAAAIRRLGNQCGRLDRALRHFICSYLIGSYTAEMRIAGGLTQSFLKEADYHGAIEEWLRRDGSLTVFLFSAIQERDARKSAAHVPRDSA
jgi:hypothetical protein